MASFGAHPGRSCAAPAITMPTRSRTSLPRTVVDLVEVHNRGRLFRRLAKRLGPQIRLCLYLHNDPQTMEGLRTPIERARLLQRASWSIVSAATSEIALSTACKVRRSASSSCPMALPRRRRTPTPATEGDTVRRQAHSGERCRGTVRRTSTPRERNCRIGGWRSSVDHLSVTACDMNGAWRISRQYGESGLSRKESLPHAEVMRLTRARRSRSSPRVGRSRSAGPRSKPCRRALPSSPADRAGFPSCRAAPDCCSMR